MNNEMKISIAIAPTWSTVKEVLEKATAFLSGKGKSEDFISATAMCATELIENAVKYGVETPGGKPISFEMLMSDTRIHIVVSNGIKDERDLVNVRKILRTIEQADDPQALYVDRLRRLIEDPRPGVSQLGFYRIVYEGQFNLEHEYEDGILKITADRAVP